MPAFMEYLRGVAIMTVANAEVEIQVPLPTSRTESLAMLIHMCRFDLGTESEALGVARKSIFAQLSFESIPVGNQDIADSRVFERIARVMDSAGAVTTWVIYEPWVIYYKPARLLASPNVFFKVDSTGFINPTKAEFVLGYTLEKVPKDDFIAALIPY